MNISDLLTILTIVLAVYAILPRTKILDIKLRLTYIDWFLILCTGLFLLYLQFYDVFATLNLTPKLNLSKYNLNPHNFSFVVVLLLTLYLFIKTHLTPLSAHKLNELKNLFEQLSYGEKMGEMVSLLDKHYNKLVKFYAQRRFIAHHSFDRGSNKKSLNSLNALTTEPIRKKHRPKILLYNLKGFFISRINKKNEAKRDIINDIFKLSLLRPRFVCELAKTNPYLALKILDAEIDVWSKRKFCELYLKELFSSPESILYFELNNNREIISSNRYKIPKLNKLLNFLFADTRKAEDLYAWKPIGEKTIDFLIDLQRNPDRDTYNLPYDKRYNEELRAACPLNNAIWFFDIMVTEAIYQNIKWHMWLHYFEYFTEYICKNYKLDNPDVNKDTEFPNRYSYLLYQMTSAMQSWITTLSQLSSAQENIRLASVSLRSDIENIIQSSILALGRCIYTISSSQNITDSFKKDRIESVYKLYFSVLTWPQVNQGYAELLLKSLLYAGDEIYRKDENYNSLVLNALLHIDTVPLVDDNFKKCLETVVLHFTDNYGEHDSKFVFLRRLDANTLEVKSKQLYHSSIPRTYNIKC